MGALASILGAIRGLGATTPSGMPYGPYRYGTKQYWQWYATIYLPRYYNQQQIIQLLQRNPMYNIFGMPAPYNYGYSSYGFGPAAGYPGTYYPYGSASYSNYAYNNPYATGYMDPYLQAYNYQNADSGAQACAGQGGVWDWWQQACGLPGSVVERSTGDVPNVVGLDKYSAIQLLNSVGWAVWLLNEDGYSQGVPTDYNPRRVLVTVQAGKITGASVG